MPSSIIDSSSSDPQRQTQPLQPPVDLGDGLIMRWSTRADADNLGDLIADSFRHVSFLGPLPQDEMPEPNELLRAAGRRVLRGNHPLLSENDYALVEDTTLCNDQDGSSSTANPNPIVACVGLFTFQAKYGCVDLKVTNPEMIATRPAYRRRGLVRQLMTLIHQKCDDSNKRSVIQFIVGIPYFYRQFGYEYGFYYGTGQASLDVKTPTSQKILFGSTIVSVDRSPSLLPTTEIKEPTLTIYAKETTPTIETTLVGEAVVMTNIRAEPPLSITKPLSKEVDTTDHQVHLRIATLGDIPFLLQHDQPQYSQYQATFRLLHDQAYWQYFVHDALLTAESPQYDVGRLVRIIVHEPTGKDIGVVVLSCKGKLTLEMFTLDTLMVTFDQIWEHVLKQAFQAGQEFFSTRYAKGPIRKVEQGRDHFDQLVFQLGPTHPVLDLIESTAATDLKRTPGQGYPTYARIVSYSDFILQVQPELERRLKESATTMTSSVKNITACLQLDFYRQIHGSNSTGLEIKFEEGKIVSVQDWVKPSVESKVKDLHELKKSVKSKENEVEQKSSQILSAAFAPLSFHSLLTGSRTLQQVCDAFPETVVRSDVTRELLDCLFPKGSHSLDSFWF